MPPSQPSRYQPEPSESSAFTARGNASAPSLRGPCLLLGILIVVSSVAYSFHFQSFMHAKELVWAFGGPLAVIVGWQVFRRFDGFKVFLPLWIAVAVQVTVHAAIVPAQMPERVVESTSRFVMMLGIAALFYHLVRDTPSRRRLEAAFVLSGIVVGLLALLQYARLVPFLFPEFPHYDQRAYSVFGNQDLLGGYLAIALIVMMARIASAPPSRLREWAALVVLVAGLMASASRSAWLAAVAGIVVLLLRRDTRVWTSQALLVAVLPAVAAACLVIPEATLARLASVMGPDDQGVWLRLWIWDGSIRMIADHAWLGVGPGNHSFWSPRYLGEALFAYEHWQHAHNEVHTLHAECEWLELWAETGVVGVMLIAWQGARLRRYRGVLWAPMAAFLAFTVFNTVSHSMPHVLWALFLAAVMLAETDAASPRDTEFATAFHFGLLLTAGVLAAATIYAPSVILRRAERAEPFEPKAYQTALAYPWPNADAHYAFGMALIDSADRDHAYLHLTLAQRGNDTGGLHLALAHLARERGDTETAAHHARAAYRRWPSNPGARDLYRETNR